MKNIRLFSYTPSFVSVLIFSLIAESNAGQDIRFSDGWKFYLGDASGAQATTFSDASWATVYLPHTPRIELNYNTSSIYMGVCWYRKSFVPDPSFLGKKCFLEFEAAMQTAQVYVNGALAPPISAATRRS